MEAMMMTEKMIEEDQQNIINMQIKDMMKKTEEQMKKGKEQEVLLKIDIEMKALKMNMDLKDKQEETEEAIHQKENIRAKTPALTDEEGAQGP